MSAATWRLLVTEPLDGADNMALDEALQAECERSLREGVLPAPVLRFYGWAPPAVSAGRHQVLESACDLEACLSSGVDVVRRPTGGRGVLHEGEVTYSVIAPASGAFEGPGVTRASAALATVLARGLRALGADAEVARGAPSGSPRAARGACFAAASRAEVVVAGRKLCGSAQRRGAGSILQHGSLPMDFDADRHARLLGCDAAALRTQAVGLSECLGRTPSHEEVRDALVAAFEDELGVDVVPSGLLEREVEAWDERARALRSDPLRWTRAPVRLEVS